MESTPSAGLSPTIKLNKPLASSTADEIRAAASAALKALPAGRSTVFFVESDESSGGLDEGSGPDTPGDASSKPPAASATAAAGQAATSPPASPTVAGNPLAGLLGGYSDDEASGGGEDSPRVGLQHEQRESAVQQQPTQPQQPVKEQQEQQLPAQGSDQMDIELANFLQDLETSGLLSDGDADMAAAPVAANHDGSAGATSATGEADGRQEPVVEHAAHTMQAEVGAEPAGGAEDVTTAAEDAQPEQRTLGQLAGAPDWYKVLDTGSGKHYYWNVSTNEVLWEPPEGIDGNTLLPLEEAGTADGNAAAAQAAENTLAGSFGTDTEAMTDVPSVQDEQQGAATEQQLDEQADAAAGPGEQAPGRAETSALVHDSTAAAEAAAAAAGGAGEEAAQPQQAAQPAPQQDVQTVFLTLLAELQVPPAAQQLQQQLPEAVKLTLQLQLLHQQWQAFATQQQAAVDNGQPGTGFSWVTYELYIMQQLQQVVQRLQPAVQELERLGDQLQQQQETRVGGQQHGRPIQQPQQTEQTGQGVGSGPVSAGSDSEPAAGAAAAGRADKDDKAPGDGTATAAAAAAAAVAAADKEGSEEGEVAESDDEGEDMDMDVDTDPGPQPAAAAAPSKQQQASQKSAVAAGSTAASAAERYTAAGTYTSTTHMPRWARPSYHYDFHAPHPAEYRYGMHAYRHPYAAADYHHHYAAAGYEGAGYDAAGYAAAGYAGYDAAGYGAAGYGAAAAVTEAGAVAAAEQPPLPGEAPPPLPDEPAPPGDAEPPPPLPSDDSSNAVADHTATAAPPAAGGTPAPAPVARRKAIVAQAAVVHRPAAVVEPAGPLAAEAEGAGEAAAAAAAAVAGGSSSEVRKRARELGTSKSAAPSTKMAKAGKVSALISKWATVRQQQEVEELEKQRKAEAAADPEVQEAKRLQQLEAWRVSQLQSGAAEDNPNFTPVVGDWRARLGLGSGDAAAAAEAAKAAAAADGAPDADAQSAADKAARKAARKAAKAAKAAAAAAAAAAVKEAAPKWPTNSKTKPDLEALSQGLPAGWRAMWEATSGDIYYGNPSTKEVSWDRPTE